jgi:hypothetical protein
MGFLTAMLVAYIPFFHWVFHECKRQMKDSNKTH